MDKNDSKTKKHDRKEVEDLKQKAEEFENKYKRAIADYQNLDKRVAEERKELILRSNKELLLRLLPVLDTLMLVEQHSEDEGIRLTVQQFLDILKLEGVERIETKDKVFDPELMECISTIEGEENKVIEELRVGYKIYDKILRVAQVRVGEGNKN